MAFDEARYRIPISWDPMIMLPHIRRLSLLMTLHCLAMANQSTGQTKQVDPMILTVYSVGDLPVYRVVETGEPVFDASLLISHLKKTVDHDSWNEGATIVPIANSKALIISQTRLNHRTIASILYRMHLFATPVDADILEAAMKSAKTTNRRVLVSVADPTSKGCERFLEVFESPEAQKIASHYVLVGIRNDRITDLPPSWRDGLALGRDELLVIDPNQRVISRLSMSGSTTKAQYSNWLAEWVTELGSAESAVASALQQAKDSGKRTMLIYSGPACVHCDRLKAFLGAFEAEFSKDYVRVVVDTRMDGAAKMTETLGRTEDEIPWFAILSEDGQPLETSESEFGNIGFPVDRDGWLHFRKMIDKTRVAINDRELEKLFGRQIDKEEPAP